MSIIDTYYIDENTNIYYMISEGWFRPAKRVYTVKWYDNKLVQYVRVKRKVIRTLQLREVPKQEFLDHIENLKYMGELVG